MEDMANKKEVDARMEQKIFDIARTFLVQNREKVHEDVRKNIKEAGGLKEYLMPYIEQQIADIYQDFDTESMTKAVMMRKMIEEQEVCEASKTFYIFP